ncbi:MAG: asparagine synthase (glutamine-hydrolyzing) [Betaproteobacteria bacterium]|nr:asparagine synthase (glutamine-hydrolyzing) [Betaproteobacteria bacterium]
MCGIAGFFGRAPRPAKALDLALERLARRGPDASHRAAWDAHGHPLHGHPLHSQPAQAGVQEALLHARLAIIDPRPEADQPMSSDDGQVWICYNGEVYGWADDAAELSAAGARFRTRSDTEFILRAYERWGLEETLRRLRGMYAFALLDRRRGEVHLARDPMGKKPLIYAVRGGELTFASTVRALLPLLGERPGFDPDALDAYLAHRTIPAPATVFQGVQRLPAGHALSFSLHTRQTRLFAHWQPAPDPGADWRERLDEAVRLRCVADRPVGLFLSGGIDSTLVAARLHQMGQPLLAFTAAFPGSSMDESAEAARTAAALGLRHRAVPIPERIRDDFARIVADLDEPFADPSAFPLWYLAREATREVKVVLAGDGGDELLAGYKRYRQHLRSAWRGSLRWPQRGWTAHPDPQGWAKLRQELALDWESAYSLRFSGFSPAQRAWFQPTRAAGLPATRWRLPEGGGVSPLHRLLVIDMANYLPEYILRKGDLTTMAHGLELRAPLLDVPLYRAILALPDADRFTRPAKTLFAPLLPPDLAQRLFGAPKRGFNPPLRQWLREDLAERLDGLDRRLETVTDGVLDARAVAAFLALYHGGREALAEGVLQLVILEESLRQLRECS